MIRRIPAMAFIAMSIGLCSATAVIASGGGTAVPPGGKIAGRGYSQWLEVFWKTFFRTPPSASVCQTVHTSIGPVAVLIGGGSGKKETDTCREPANRPIFVDGLAAECSTIEPPPSHGNTPAQLKRCARRQMTGVEDLSIAIDGHQVMGWTRYITASPVFTFHMPKHNRLGTRKRTGQSAAYGEGLLLRGLPPGTHTVHETGELPGFLVDLTYKLRVQ